MHTRRGLESKPDNVDRRRGFLDLVERLGLGVVAIVPRDPVSDSGDDEVDRDPAPRPKTDRSRASG